MQDVINQGLAKIAIRSKEITVADVKQALAKQYPMLKMNDIEVTLQDNNAIIKSLNENVYTGSHVVINNLLIDLSSVLTNNLSTFEIPGKNQPSHEQIMQALTKTNINLDVTKITIAKITDSSADISGDGITYKGMVPVSFVVNDNIINIKSLSYNYRETNSVGSIKTTWASPDITLLPNWRDYALDWDSFTNKFNKLSFGDQSYFHVYCNTYTDKKLSGAKLSVATNDIIVVIEIKVHYSLIIIMMEDFEEHFFN